MNRRHFYKLFSFLVFLILSLQIVVIQELRGQCDPTTDLNTLKALYNAGWRLNGWNNTETNPANMANWEGVFLSDDGCVKELNVGGKNLAELASNNGGDRSIPTAIGGFTNLKLLWLNNNGFTGVIPEVLFNISRVDRNNANSNSKLTNLYLQQNNFTPSTLTGFAKLVNLVTFGFDRNKSPFSEANFPDLTNVDEVDQFFIRNHDFNDIPNFKVSFTKSPGNPSGRNIEVSGNRLTFEDLMRFAELSEPLDGFYFFPQNPFRVAQNTYDLTEGDDLNINLGVDENVNGNIYKWFKDGNEIPNKTTNPLTIQNVAIEDAGTYYCEVTNATFDQNTQKYIQNGNNSQSLVLTSENIVVTVNANEEINCRRDAEVLEKLIDANFKYDDTWKKDDIKNFASWAGIKTNNEGCIIALDLTERNITGPIPAEIGDLADLEELKLGNNQITGDLPATFAKLNKLKILHLAENNLGGNLAEYQVIFDITSLEELLLYSNNIGGTIPSSIAGSNPNEGLSQNLNFLSIGDNNLTGTIPNELYNLTKLTKLHLNLNQLTGGISPEISKLTSLIHLRISDNNFDQPFPTELGNISTLQRLWFKNNNFTFDDLLPIVNYANLGNIESLWYAQQGDFITSTPFEGTEGELLEVTLDFEDTNDSNLYSWYKEGETTPQFQLTGSKTLPLDPLLNENAGLYRVEVTNPTFQQALQIFDNDNEPLVIPSANNVEIIVNEGNNPPTDITLTNDVINSDAAPGSLVGNLTTTDADPNDTHTYELTDFCIPTETNNNVLFAISENQLVLASGFSLDASLASLLVCITSTDRAGASYSKKFTIRINKINNPPTDILLTNSVIDAADAQGGFTIDELSTVDLDNPDDVHTYTLANNCEPVVPNNNDQFVIEDNELKLTTGFQYDPQVTELQICVTTTDRAQASYSKNFQITIRPTIEECVVNDKTVLEALYDALGGDSWDADARLNWKSNLPLNQWGGVTTNDDGCVTRIILEGKNLVGTIPTEIGNLSEILEINFGKNNISGTIPAAFGNLATLKILWLNENQLSGQVPLGFFNMINLTNLYLFQNNLQPPLPNELNQLTKLIVFGFDNNETKFADADFPNINNLIALERFYIQNHAFEDVPAIVNPNLLTEIGIARNKLTFEDILPYAPLTLNVFSYAPQDSVGDGGSFTVNSGENFTINLEIDQNITNNTYKWYKDGALVFEGNSNSYTVEAVEEQDAGKYTCEVTNREAPELTLYARAVTLIVTPVTPLPPPVLTAELDGNNPAERIILNWTYSLEYTPENYFIERSQGDSLNFSVINNNWNQKTYTDGDGLQAGETYFYRVKAVVNREESPYSNIAYVTTNSLPVVADIDKVGSTNVVMPFTLAEFTNAYTDVDNDPLATIQILSLPTNGRLSLGNTDLNINAEVTANEIANVVFTPDADWAGNTSFSYNSSDGYNYAANPAQVNIAIEQIEDVDLIVENPDLNTNSVAAGNDIGLSVVISTKGTVDSGSAEFVYLLSTDTIADQNDIVLKSEQIPPQQSGSVLSLNTSVTVPEDTEPGSYYIIYYVDAQEQVLEFNEINNLRTLAINIEPFREDPGIVIMNLITPNNDGLNDKLYIKNIEAYPDNEVVLLDRWGNEIFRAEGYNNEWIPVLDEDIVDFGSYVCIVKVNIDDITLEPIKRMVSIVSGNNQ